MDKVDIINDNKSSLNNLAADGVIYGLMGGIIMYILLAALALFSGENPAALLARFSTGQLTSPIRGLLSHLAVSAIYGALFGMLVWPLLTRFTARRFYGYIGGLLFGSLLFLLSHIAVLPITNSPLGEIPTWEWGLGHALYGLVLGGLFASKVGKNH
jgi:hypothetical protein